MDSDRLMDLYRLQTEEVRFQVQIGWDRAKSSLTFHIALLGLIAAFGREAPKTVVVGILIFICISSAISAVMVITGHDYYRRARDQRRKIEARLGVEYGFVTTPGSTGERRNLWDTWPKITTGIVALHLLICASSFMGMIWRMR